MLLVALSTILLRSPGHATFKSAFKHTLSKYTFLNKKLQLQQKELQSQLPQKELQLQLQQIELQSQLQQQELQLQSQLQQKELQSQLQQIELQSQLQLQQQELQLQSQLHQKELQLKDMQLQNLTLRLLVENGKLTMRGLTEFGEEHLLPVGCRMEALYSHLSGHPHAHKYQHSSSEVDIVEGPVSREQVVLLECLAQVANVPYRTSTALS